jgi:hypothetical protein
MVIKIVSAVKTKHVINAPSFSNSSLFTIS